MRIHPAPAHEDKAGRTITLNALTDGGLLVEVKNRRPSGFGSLLTAVRIEPSELRDLIDDATHRSAAPEFVSEVPPEIRDATEPDPPTDPPALDVSPWPELDDETAYQAAQLMYDRQRWAARLDVVRHALALLPTRSTGSRGGFVGAIAGDTRREIGPDVTDALRIARFAADDHRDLPGVDAPEAQR